MATINLRDMDDGLARRAKVAAIMAGKSLRDWVAGAMAKELAGEGSGVRGDGAQKRTRSVGEAESQGVAGSNPARAREHGDAGGTVSGDCSPSSRKRRGKEQPLPSRVSSSAAEPGEDFEDMIEREEGEAREWVKTETEKRQGNLKKGLCVHGGDPKTCRIGTCAVSRGSENKSSRK